jgi:hypothetical protein
MPEISDFQRTNSEFAKSEQKYPVKIILAYADYRPAPCIGASFGYVYIIVPR